MEKLIRRIKKHEGFRDRIYLDSENKPTCGWGHYLWVRSKVPLAACEAFLDQDIQDALADYRKIPHSTRRKLSPARIRVIVEMLFNMGYQKVLGFKKMWLAIENEDYLEAKLQMLDSKWAEQVGKKPGQRAYVLAEIMEKGVDE